LEGIPLTQSLTDVECSVAPTFTSIDLTATIETLEESFFNHVLGATILVFTVLSILHATNWAYRSSTGKR
jgi:hypothetical protein